MTDMIVPPPNKRQEVGCEPCPQRCEAFRSLDTWPLLLHLCFFNMIIIMWYAQDLCVPFLLLSSMF